MLRKKRKRGRNPFKPTYRSNRLKKGSSAWKTAREECRATVWTRDEMRCVFPGCGQWVALEAAHIHEVIFRSQGGDPLNPDECVTLCWECHDHIHRRIGGVLKRIEGFTIDTLEFFARATGRDEWMEVT